MRKTSAFLISGLLVVGLAAPTWAANSGPAAKAHPGGHATALSEVSGTDARASEFESNRHRYHRHGHDRDGRWYYRDGRWHHDDRYRYGHPHYRGGPTRHCHDGEWRYHPKAGWMCV